MSWFGPVMVMVPTCFLNENSGVFGSSVELDVKILHVWPKVLFVFSSDIFTIAGRLLIEL